MLRMCQVRRCEMDKANHAHESMRLRCERRYGGSLCSGAEHPGKSHTISFSVDAQARGPAPKNRYGKT